MFEGDEKIELRDRALAFVAAELSRYSLLSTDTDAKGMAYEAITSTTMKRERGQFFTPRNMIRMMVEIVDPQPAVPISRAERSGEFASPGRWTPSGPAVERPQGVRPARGPSRKHARIQA